MNSLDVPQVDASVHPAFASDRDLRSYLREPFASRGYSHIDVPWFAPPGPRYAPDSAPAEGAHPGSDPDHVGKVVFDERGLDYAVLLPQSVGAIQPDWHLGNALISATNQMLAERWLESGTYASKFRGTIRVNPNDVEGAVREIARWKDHPGMVQIGVPLQAQQPYGRPHYRALWRAAAESGLPVVVHIEDGAGITHPPTPIGITRTFSNLTVSQPINFVYHLLNMIAEGVFEELPDLKVIFADGAADMLTPFIWRMDTFGRPHLEQTPWSPKIPSDYLAEHVYFVHGLLDGPGDAEFAAEWLTMTGKEDMLLYGSSHPNWADFLPEKLPAGWTADQRAKVLGGNAATLFGLPVPASV